MTEQPLTKRWRSDDQPAPPPNTNEDNNNNNEEEDNEDDDVEGDRTTTTTTTTEKESDVRYPVRGEPGFNSEYFKIEIQNLPKHKSIRDVKQLLTRHKIDHIKVKKERPWTYAFVTFANNEDVQKAREALKGVEYKGQMLTTKIAKPWIKENFLKSDGGNGNAGFVDDGRETSPVVEDPRPVDERLADQVTPLWRQPYADQLKLKFDQSMKILEDFVRQVSSAVQNNEKASILDFQWLQSSIPLLPTIPSPEVNYYRNKCEFGVARGVDELPTVGFQLGLYRNGVTTVAEPGACLHIPQVAKDIARSFQAFVRDSSLPPFSRISLKGNWRMLVIRNSSLGKCLAVVQVHPQQLTSEEIQKVKDDLREYFLKEKEGGLPIENLLLQLETANGTLFADKPFDTLLGEPHIMEELLGYRFRISPTAFFQVNKAAAEKMFQLVTKYGKLDKQTVLLDLCCGTGIIGICLSGHCKRVIGVELSQAAVNDANYNSLLNNISNVKFVCARLETVISSIIAEAVADKCKVVAVLDPPRPGVHSDVIRCIRGCGELKNVVYLACDGKAASNNFVDLCRPTSNRFPGAPFHLVQATPVDMFPHTHAFELVLQFHRD